ncbi:hypothetical protein, partial [Sinorhizobium meliloti]|uniref:hypothetical protein n=1 Tax=Rhizobium meliloti TaxID=382 RepID=UPI001AECA1D7
TRTASRLQTADDMKNSFGLGKKDWNKGRHSRFGEVKDLPPDAPKLGQFTFRNNYGMRMLLLFHAAADAACPA